MKNKSSINTTSISGETLISSEPPVIDDDNEGLGIVY
jgi:hypothetical protein